MMNNQSQSFGTYLKILRENRGLSVRQLTKLSGVSNGYLSLLENEKRGIPSLEVLQKLADALDIPFPQLVSCAGFELNQDTSKRIELPEPVSPRMKRWMGEFKKFEHLSGEQFEDLLKTLNQLAKLV